VPQAVQVGLEHLQAHPECAFVFGQHRGIDSEGSPRPFSDPTIFGDDHYVTLLRHCFICVPAAALYRREVFEAVGGFDSSLSAAEDYDMYLRIARQYPICRHEAVVAKYRRHGANMSGNATLMLRSLITVLRRQWPYVRGDADRTAAYWAGLRFLHNHYGRRLTTEVQAQVERREWGPVLRGLGTLLRYHREGIPSLLRPTDPISSSDSHSDQRFFGNLRRLTPISRDFGYDRGQPIDRYYIEQFLARHTGDVQGRVLEIGDNAYTTQFGGSRVRISDVLHVDGTNPAATIVGDLTHADHIPSDTFDCIILTQTLQFIYDVPAAIRTLHRVLKPDGILLATFPGVSQISRDRWGESWYWGFSTLSAQRLFEEVFSAAAVIVESRGNVLTAMAIIHGLSAEELYQAELDYDDSTYQVLVTVKAVKGPTPPSRPDLPGGQHSTVPHPLFQQLLMVMWTTTGA
jgi:SAM-dependent methyltransferase